MKRNLKRKSTFSQPSIRNEDLEDPKEFKKNGGKEKPISSHELTSLSSPTKDGKKPNAFDEIVKLNNEIHFRSNLKRKSTFSLPMINDEDIEEEDGKSDKHKVKINEDGIKIKEEPSMEEKEEADEKQEEGDE